jgi:hypothetical protein
MVGQPLRRGEALRGNVGNHRYRDRLHVDFAGVSHGNEAHLENQSGIECALRKQARSIRLSGNRRAACMVQGNIRQT